MSAAPLRSVIIMGVSGSGKSHIGALLAQRLGLEFIDGDDLHSPANRGKMASGIALDDADRAPWLDAVAAALTRGPLVIACSALRRRYRDRLRQAAPPLRFVYLSGSRDLLAQRLAHRQHEYMPPQLLDSQLATLEPPAPDELALVEDIARAPEQIVDAAVKWLQPGPDSPSRTTRVSR